MAYTRKVRFSQVNFSEKPFEHRSGTYRRAVKVIKYGNDLRTPDGSAYVLKNYVPNTVPITEEEDAVRKNVQAHMLARNVAGLLKLEAPKEYGETFTYGKPYFARDDSGKPYFIEPFLDGQWVKYINNNGAFCPRTFTQYRELSQKAESFCHFSYISLHQQAMVLDLQGVGRQLTDPEIATNETGNASTKLFNAGNLDKATINQFLGQHNCNKYCKMLKLSSN